MLGLEIFVFIPRKMLSLAQEEVRQGEGSPPQTEGP